MAAVPLVPISHATNTAFANEVEVASKFLSKAAEEEGIKIQALSPRDIRWISRGLSAGEAGIRSIPENTNPATVSSQQPNSRPYFLDRSPRGSRTAGARQHKIHEQSIGISHDVPSAHSRNRALQEAVPTLKSTLNLFEVSNFPSFHHSNSTLALDNISAKTSRPQKFEEISRVSCETVLKANFRHQAPAPLAQQLYSASNLQPLKDYESVREINLQPRTKASPRAATFLKHAPHNNAHTTLLHQPAHTSDVLESCVASSTSGGSSLKETSSHSISELVIHTNIIQDAVEDAAGGKQRIQSHPQVSFVDIRLPKSVHHQNSLFVSPRTSKEADLQPRQKQMRSSPGQPPALEAVPPPSTESRYPTSEGWNIRSSSTHTREPNGAAQSSNFRSTGVSKAVPSLDLSALQSVITSQQIQPCGKNTFDQIQWPPRIPRAPRMALRPSPAGPTPLIGASRGCESERYTKSDSRSLWSARSPACRHFSAGQDALKSKVALVVAQGMDLHIADLTPPVSSTSLATKHLHDYGAELAAPSPSSVSKICQQHPEHPPNRLEQNADVSKKTTSSLFVIEPMLRHSVSLHQVQTSGWVNPMQKANNEVLTSAVTFSADDSGRVTARQYIPLQPAACNFAESSLLSKMETALFEWAEQSKLLQRAQERNNNEGGVGCLGVQASLLDPKLMSKEPKHRAVQRKMYPSLRIMKLRQQLQIWSKPSF